MSSTETLSDSTGAVQVVASTKDHEAVAAIWQHMQQLLSTEHTAAQAAIRLLAQTLPDLSTIRTQDLPVLAQLHLNSATNLMTTMKLMLPQAFQGDSLQPDLDALCNLPGDADGMVATLVELQLFHLSRARDVTLQMRKRIAQRRTAEAQQLRRLQSLLTCDASSSDGVACDDGLVKSLE